MIDYVSIAPVMSLSTFIAGFLIILLIGRAFVELVDIYGKKKSPQELIRVRAGGQAKLSVSQKAIQRYYDRRGA